jgi:hypothetical protein
MKNLIAAPQSVQPWQSQLKGLLQLFGNLLFVVQITNPTLATALKKNLKLMEDILSLDYSPASVQAAVADLQALITTLVNDGILPATNVVVAVAADIAKFEATVADYDSGQAAVLGSITFDGKHGHILAVADGGAASQALGG